MYLCSHHNANLITMAHNEKCETVEALMSAIQVSDCILDDFIDVIIATVYDKFATKVQHFLHNSF